MVRHREAVGAGGGGPAVCACVAALQKQLRQDSRRPGVRAELERLQTRLSMVEGPLLKQAAAAGEGAEE